MAVSKDQVNPGSVEYLCTGMLLSDSWLDNPCVGPHHKMPFRNTPMPNRYLPESRFAAIRSKIEDNREPHATAWATLKNCAGKALEAPLVSVRDSDGSPHFTVDSVYLTDGVFDKSADRRQSEAIAALSRMTVDLALAYRISGEAKFAEKALALIHAWCIDENTRMYPEGRVDGPASAGNRMNGDIVFFMQLNDTFLACYLLDDYPAWDIEALAATRRWVRSMVAVQRDAMFYKGARMVNNWEDARLLYLAKAALFLDDMDMLSEVFDTWKRNLPIKMDAEGFLPAEAERTRSMTYHLAAIDMVIEVAEIAKAHSVDLYRFEAQGRSAKLGVDLVTRYLLNFESWPHEQLDPESVFAKGKHRRFLEMAYQQWGEQACFEAIEKCGGRPLLDCHATLLFA